jgi:hypothetical protein
VKRWVVAEEAAPAHHLSPWTLRDKFRRGECPGRKLAGVRRIWFDPDELMAWANGAELEVIERGGTRIVRPKLETY